MIKNIKIHNICDIGRHQIFQSSFRAFLDVQFLKPIFNEDPLNLRILVHPKFPI
jgi:hypothetical protein